MESKLARKLCVSYEPVAILFSQEKPPDALEGKSDCWSCIVPLFLAAAKGKTAVFEQNTVRCNGGKVGLGLGKFPNYPGGVEYFLSTGKEGIFAGEGYRKTPELAAGFVDGLPYANLPAPYLVFKPLSAVDPQAETPALISFYINVNQLSALTILANYDRPTNNNVIIPSASGCQALFLLPYHEAQQEIPRAVVGMMDITVRPMLELDKMTFTMPYAMFLTMEENVDGSFLEKPLWDKIIKKMNAE